MSGHLPRASHKPSREYSFSHGGISLSLPSDVFLARVTGISVWVTPSHDDPNRVGGGNTFCLLFFSPPPLLNVTFFHRSDCFGLPFLVGRAGWMVSSSSSLPVPSRPVPSPLPALLHRSVGWEKQRGRVFLMPRAWKGLWGYFAWFLFQAEIYAEAKREAGKNKINNPQAPVRCWSHKQVQQIAETYRCLQKA